MVDLEVVWCKAEMPSEDDLNLQELTDEELDRAWDLWFDLAQSTNDWDPPYSHGVLVGLEMPGDPRAAGDPLLPTREQR